MGYERDKAKSFLFFSIESDVIKLFYKQIWTKSIQSQKKKEKIV